MLTDEEVYRLRDIVREVIEEREAERMAHPEKRERITRYTGPDGETFHSVTQTRLDWAKTLAAVIMAISVAVSAINVVVVYPIIDRRASALIERHSTESKAKMDEIAKQIVFRSDFVAYTSEKEERWKNQAQVNTEMREMLAELNKDIKELLRRVR